jgi:hypothetical protein
MNDNECPWLAKLQIQCVVASISHNTGSIILLTSRYLAYYFARVLAHAQKYIKKCECTWLYTISNLLVYVGIWHDCKPMFDESKH